jgi:ABC-type amino acid transport substrate-binding protein
VSYDFLKLFEDELNKKLKKEKKRPVDIVFITVSRDQLIPALREGRGDIAASGITMTPGRERLVDFSNPTYSPVNEVVVMGPGTPEVTTFADLSGQEIFVRPSSSYCEHLVDLNATLEKSGKTPIRL